MKKEESPSALIIVYLTISKQKIDFNMIKGEILFLFISGIAMGINWIFLFRHINIRRSPPLL